MLDLIKISNALDKCEGQDLEEDKALFNEIILAEEISVKSLKERGITPETLLAIASNASLYFDNLRDACEIQQELLDSAQKYNKRVVGRRRLF